ncbi:Quinolinate phosphoribosyl transferase [Neohortaea acidophila]|uniref:Nicotinate phosphoribosyltransferase n=1 Tax=Neohortaea acidophila TaxID=245834 RepID=A0A6A6Q335_9PEZI|nr:Quinolinate phosphoribosyl transferase [Neohortaea acidophila]KAF2486705.1 Quinolinate phosphoribosyl transferase [Neohortaea acidophila]
MATTDDAPSPEGIFSLLDTDLYKLTMQCAILKFFPDVHVAFAFTNRTPHMKLTRAAYRWLQEQIGKLKNLHITAQEVEWLRTTCPYLSSEYLEYLESFRLRPEEQVQLAFDPDETGEGEDVSGNISLSVRGLWLETILYEIPLLALISEAYFKFVDRDWTHANQVENAKRKGLTLLEHGCLFSEFGSRRRRDYKTHESVIRGLVDASKEAETNGQGWQGKFTGTSNVHLAMRFGVPPIGTVAHEWFMAIAAITDDYANANELAMKYWIATFGRGVLAIALTDTFGTTSFLRAFVKPAPPSNTTNQPDRAQDPSYAQVFTGVRQDSGDPLAYLQIMKKFYTSQGITDKKVIVYSDSLNTDKCIQYRRATVEAGLSPSFGIGTFFTNDFVRASRPDEKSVPLNIVIKLSEANGRPAVKLSDNKSKNMGDEELVRKVKQTVGYEEREWKEGDEAHRWDK